MSSLIIMKLISQKVKKNIFYNNNNIVVEQRIFDKLMQMLYNFYIYGSYKSAKSV